VWRRKSRETSFSLYYASDVHGSDLCWRKFIGARRHYKADVIVMGGDLTGKAVVPIVREPDGRHHATFLGEEQTARTEEELDRLFGAIRYNGMYPWVASQEEITAAANDAGLRAQVFESAILGELRRWCRLAAEKTASDPGSVLVMAGNDDPWSCDEVIESELGSGFCDDRIVALANGMPMVSLSYANPTPWDSPRELPEDELYRRLAALMDQVEEPSLCVLNAHVPPYDSGLDRATELDDDFRPVLKGGVPHEIPVGSTAVREIIEHYQPLLSVHGHIHESRGQTHIGRTLVINPGSEYNTGRIHGAVVRFDGDQVATHQLVVG